MGEHLVNIPRQIYIKQMLVSKHMVTVCKSQLTNVVKCFWASVPFYHASLFNTQISILIGYKRLFATPRMRLVCFCTIELLAVYGLWAFKRDSGGGVKLLFSFSGRHVTYRWPQASHDSKQKLTNNITHCANSVVFLSSSFLKMVKSSPSNTTATFHGAV